jgi:A/G-specific adenine glycosylase
MEALLGWYAEHGRTHLPWRRTRDPYRVLVSEFMLQQTQVERVIGAYETFLAAFPDVHALAAAPAADVVRRWRGLGYNSRALRLHAAARAIVRDRGGRFPIEREALLALPGIGPYTASALRAFAFEVDDVALDTNLRRIIHRTQFGLEYPPAVAPRELDARARALLPAGKAHAWNSALMDLGATICTARAPKCLICPLRHACAAAPVDPVDLAARAALVTKRSPQEALPFERTARFLRGRIVDALRDLAPGASVSLAELRATLAERIVADRLDEIPATVGTLERDGFIERIGEAYRLR